MTALAKLLPHAGAMVLLDELVSWDATIIVCTTRSHLRPGNPLCRAERLSAVCGVEYGLQAAALHGAMIAGGVAQRAGYVARLRMVELRVDRLDDIPGALTVEATLEHAEPSGMLYALLVADAHGRPLVTGRASIALPR